MRYSKIKCFPYILHCGSIIIIISHPSKGLHTIHSASYVTCTPHAPIYTTKTYTHTHTSSNAHPTDSPPAFVSQPADHVPAPDRCAAIEDQSRPGGDAAVPEERRLLFPHRQGGEHARPPERHREHPRLLGRGAPPHRAGSRQHVQVAGERFPICIHPHRDESREWFTFTVHLATNN